MRCPCCEKEVVPDSYFCLWCGAFQPDPDLGGRAGLFARWFALFLDPFLFLLKWAFAFYVLAMVLPPMAALAAIFLFPAGYVVWFLISLGQGQTPGKKLLGLQVVHQQTGEVPGFATMFVREVIGRFVSGLFLSLGYFWAIFDKNSQAWHDKIAGTVVVKLREPRRFAALPAMLVLMIAATGIGMVRGYIMQQDRERAGNPQFILHEDNTQPDPTPIEPANFVRPRTEPSRPRKFNVSPSLPIDDVSRPDELTATHERRSEPPRTSPMPPDILGDLPTPNSSPRNVVTQDADAAVEERPIERPRQPKPVQPQPPIAENKFWRFEVLAANYEDGKISVQLEVRNNSEGWQVLWAEQELLRNQMTFAALVTDDGQTWSVSHDHPLVDHGTFGPLGEGLQKVENKSNVYLPQARRTHTLVFTADRPTRPQGATLHLALSVWDADWAKHNGFTGRPRPIQFSLKNIPVNAGPAQGDSAPRVKQPRAVKNPAEPFVASDPLWKIEVVSATLSRGRITVTLEVHNQGDDRQLLWLENSLFNDDADIAWIVSDSGATWYARRQDQRRSGLFDEATTGNIGIGFGGLRGGARNQYLPNAKKTHTFVFTAEQAEVPETLTLYLNFSGWDAEWDRRNALSGRPRSLQFRVADVPVRSNTN